MDNSNSNGDDQLVAPVSGMGLLQVDQIDSENSLDLNKEIVITILPHHKATAKQLIKTATSRVELIELLTTHKIGDKEGICFTQGAIIDGAERKKQFVEENSIIGFDIDTGEPSEELIERLNAFECAYVIYSTHSHGKANTEVTAKALATFVGRSIENLQLTREEATRFLHDEKNYHLSVLEDVYFEGKETNGKFTIQHAPMSKHRIVFFLETPFEFQKDSIVKERNLAWQEYYRGVGLKLGIDFDTTCTDSSRLFFLPRYPKDGTKPFSKFVNGKALRLEDFERVPKWAERTTKKTAPKSSTFNRSQVESSIVEDSERYTFKGFNLKRWTINYNFKPVATLVAAEYLVRDDIAEGKASFQCPFYDDHSRVC